MSWRTMALRAPDGADGSAPAPPVTPAPAPVTPAPAPPAPPVAPPAPTPPAPQANQPAWLPSRLAEERRKAINDVVSKLGIKVGKKDDPDAKIQEALAKLESGKEKRRLLRDRVALLEGNAQENAALKATIKVFAESEMASLPEAMRASVKTIAGEDHVRQLETIAGYRLAGLVPNAPAAPAAPAVVATPVVAPAPPPAPTAPGTPPAAPPAPPAPPPPIAAPVTSAPPTPGPVPTNPNAPADLVAEVTRLGQSSDPRDKMRARLLVLQNPRAYAEASDKSRSR